MLNDEDLCDIFTFAFAHVSVVLNMQTNPLYLYFLSFFTVRVIPLVAENPLSKDVISTERQP